MLEPSSSSDNDARFCAKQAGLNAAFFLWSLRHLRGAIKKFCNFDMKHNHKISISVSFFDIVSWDLNAFCHFSGKLFMYWKTILCPALQTMLRQQLLGIHYLQTGTMKMRFQISEQITVTRNQIWTVGRVVYLKKCTVANSLQCNKWLVNWRIVAKKSNTQWQFPPTFLTDGAIQFRHNFYIILANNYRLWRQIIYHKILKNLQKLS